jgi:xylitol oxidase
VAELERRLAPMHARPHWGKVFSSSPETVRELYPRLAEFQALRSDLDPAGTFGNAMVDRYLG